MTRDLRLHGLSSDHHHALVLAQRAVRAASSEEIGISVDWAWKETLARFEKELLPHFPVEEQLLLPALRRAGEIDLVQRTLDEHAAIRRCVAGAGASDLRARLGQFGRLLEAHVRFEERELFEMAQARLDDSVLDAIAAASAADGQMDRPAQPATRARGGCVCRDAGSGESMLEDHPWEPMPAWRRIPLLALGGLALVAGIWGGLLRLGWRLPVPSAALISDHGALMICGFLGTLIGVERAVALGRWWAYGAPLLTGVGGAAVFLAAPPMLGVSAIVVGSLIFLIASIRVVFRQPAGFTITMAAGAAAWVLGNGLWWMGRPVFSLVWWWAAFLLLTIAGERLELSRLVRRPWWAKPAFVGACVLFTVGVAAATWWRDVGARVAGSGMLAVALWLCGHDVARRTVREVGLPRYVAVCFLSGYMWLLVSGILLLAYGPLTAGLEYDAALHAFFVGFVFSMIFGHAPIIFPAVLRITVHYRSLFYLPLTLLHASLIVRVVGDLGAIRGARLWGGALNAVAIVVFIAGVAWPTNRSASSPSASP